MLFSCALLVSILSYILYPRLLTALLLTAPLSFGTSSIDRQNELRRPDAAAVLVLKLHVIKRCMLLLVVVFVGAP